jgi:DNA-binding NarL/FixJ family response regulator
MFDLSDRGQVAIALRRRLDVDLLSQQLSATPFCHVVMATTDLGSATSLIQDRGAQAFILDANYPKDRLQQAVHAIQEPLECQSLLLLDDYYSPHQAQYAATIPAAYCSREIPFAETLDILERLLKCSRVAPSTTNGLIQSERRTGADHPIAAELSDRELEVMLLLAEGRSVRECASFMQLAESTIENHKFRMMRKLGVHRFTDVMRLAIRAGLIRA